MAGIMNLPKGTGKRLGSSETPYSNKEALKNGISYITGTGARTDKTEVVWYETFGLDSNPQTAVIQMETVQNFYGIERRKGRRAYHLIYTISNDEYRKMGCNTAWIREYAYCLGNHFYLLGYQTVVALHDNFILNGFKENSGLAELRFHIDIFISNVSFYNGSKLNYTRSDQSKYQMLYQKDIQTVQSQSAVIFQDTEEINKKIYGHTT